MKIYFDNTASTPLSPEVMEAMTDAMQNNFGNPSSIHHYGRLAKVTIENARKKIASYLNVSPSEIFFTSGGTEANNTAIRGAITDLGIKHAITSPTEHPAVLNTLQWYQKWGKIKLSMVELDNNGRVNIQHLKHLLEISPESFVSLMHANNEVATLLSIKEVSNLCQQYDAVFHSDMVQTMGHYKIDLHTIDVDFASCSAHKFHGPKGCGFLYINSSRIKINPLIIGGGQERNMRGGTENIVGIVGLAKAFELANENLDNDKTTIENLKAYMVEQIEKYIPKAEFLGESRNKGLYTVLNVLFPPIPSAEMLIMNLDIEGISASSGSACASGTNHRSHVLDALRIEENRPAVRFSFSKYNTNEEIDYCMAVLRKYFN